MKTKHILIIVILVVLLGLIFIVSDISEKNREEIVIPTSQLEKNLAYIDSIPLAEYELTSDVDTSDWKIFTADNFEYIDTYIDEKNKNFDPDFSFVDFPFEFRYPSDWVTQSPSFYSKVGDDNIIVRMFLAHESRKIDHDALLLGFDLSQVDLEQNIKRSTREGFLLQRSERFEINNFIIIRFFDSSKQIQYLIDQGGTSELVEKRLKDSVMFYLVAEEYIFEIGGNGKQALEIIQPLVLSLKEIGS